MNRCTPQMTLPGGNPHWSANRKKQDFSWAAPLFTLLLLCLFIFLAMTYRVSYLQKTEQLNAEIERMKAQERRLSREIANLKFRREQLCSWNMVGEKIRTHKLGLRQADPGQVRTMVLHSRKDLRKSASVKSPSVRPTL